MSRTSLSLALLNPRNGMAEIGAPRRKTQYVRQNRHGNAGMMVVIVPASQTLYPLCLTLEAPLTRQHYHVLVAAG